jgi:HSP20 family protein
MSSIRYINQTAPFWDFVASLENQGADHPFNAARTAQPAAEGAETSDQEQTWGWGPWGHHGRRGGHGRHGHRGGPWGGPTQTDGEAAETSDQEQAWAWGPRGHHGHRGGYGRHGHRAGFGEGPSQTGVEGAETSDQEQNWGWGPRGHHGPRGHGRHRGMPYHLRRGPPDAARPNQSDGEDLPPPFEEKEGLSSTEKEGSPATEKGDFADQQARDEPSEGRRHCGGRRKHCGGPGGRRGGPHKFARGPWGGRGGFPFGGGFRGFGGFEGLAGAFFNENMNRGDGDEDFKPEADVFDTEDAYVIHVSVPGAKKDDIGVSWDAEKSELSVAGVLYRPGDEDFLKTLALDERKVGAFDRKVRLGSRANPAQVDIDHISAKLEEGILRIEVPKLDKDYVEIKKVDIE